MALAACQGAYMLELDVVNESPTDAVVEVLGPGHKVAFDEVVEPGAKTDVLLERPGPGGWTILVNGQPATDWTTWPGDNPTIDLTLRIAPDGSVSVLDT